MFEYAIRNKLRFPFKGMISVEDLWDLSVENLDLVFKSLNSQLKQTKEESLLDTKTKEDEILDIKINIVKYIVKVKREEEAIRLQAKSQKQKEQKILSILAAKQEEDLQNKSVDELKAMLEGLKG
jgi:polyphosphate kinase 2 (PPK2 family)